MRASFIPVQKSRVIIERTNRQHWALAGYTTTDSSDIKHVHDEQHVFAVLLDKLGIVVVAFLHRTLCILGRIIYLLPQLLHLPAKHRITFGSAAQDVTTRMRKQFWPLVRTAPARATLAGHSQPFPQPVCAAQPRWPIKREPNAYVTHKFSCVFDSQSIPRRSLSGLLEHFAEPPHPCEQLQLPP